MDSSGNLYGTTIEGGAYGYGTVFEVAKGSSTITTLATFNGSNGRYPWALIMDSSGNLYGTTGYGGAVDDGTVFEIAKGSGTITTLATFNYSSFNYGNGANPSDLIMDSSGNLYGTTSRIGFVDEGTVFEVAKGSGTITTLATFNGSNGPGPSSLIMDSSGNLYGTTSFGGANGYGTVFEVAKGSGTITTLATFNSSNGGTPSDLIMDSSGDLYGKTDHEGAYGYGTVFEVAKGSGTITTLATFNYSNGANPSDLIMDSSGNLYGTTIEGGAYGSGTVFEVVKGSGTITSLATFNGSNGAYPWALIMDSSGNLYGITMDGGTNDDGTVFELVQNQPPQVVLNSVSTADSNELTVNYNINSNIQSEGVQSFDIDIFRSDKPAYDPTDTNNVEVASYDLTGNQLNQGSNQTITINSTNGVWGMNANTLVAPLVPDPQLPYVLAVADPEGQLPPGVTKDSTQAHFEIYTIVAVTHGQEFSNSGPASAPWVGQIVSGLQAEYNAVALGSGFVIPVYWNSWTPAPGQTQAAGDNMYNQIVAAADNHFPNIQPDDIIDVQLIGHSRGSSVIGVAMQNLINLPPVNQHLQHGYYELTFLDPHPANAATAGDVSLASLKALSGLPLVEYLTIVVDLGYILASAHANDPSITVPPRVNQVQGYYQTNSASLGLFGVSVASIGNSPWEEAFNLWGDPSQITIDDPATTLDYTVNISSTGVGHGEVPLWYLTNLAVLTNGGPPPNPIPPWPAQDPPSDPPPPSSAPDPDQLLVIPASLQVTSGAASEVYVVAVNAAGNPDTTFNGSVALSLQNSNGAALGGTLTENAVNGVAIFPDVNVDTPGNGYILQASGNGAISGSSPPFDVFTDQLAITSGPPSSVSVGSSFPIVVEAQDGSGNVDASFNGQEVVTVVNPFDDSQATQFTLTAVNGIATGTVTLTQPGEFILSATSNGVAEAFTPIDVVPVSSLITPSFSNLSAPVITYGTSSATISGQLQANGGQQIIPSGELVQVTLNGVTQNATLSGDDSFSTTFAIGSLGVAGSPYSIGLSYAGDGSFGSTSATTTLTVNPVTLTIAPSAGQSMVYGSAVPTLTYIASGFIYGDSLSLLTGLLETTATSDSSVGNYDFTLGSLSAGANYTLFLSANPPYFAVNADSTNTTVSSSASSSVYGQPVILTATVAAGPPGSGDPIGMVTFYDGSAILGTGTLSVTNGIDQAKFSTSSLSVAQHTITAIYDGDRNFLSSSGSASLVVIPPATLSGLVFEDFNDDGQVDFGENGIAGVVITLAGTDDLGNAVSRTQTTDANGVYSFGNLRPGSYTITETQPAGYTQGIDTVGTWSGAALGTVSAVAQFSVSFSSANYPTTGTSGINYNFGERPAATGPVQAGQTAGIGFWNNKNGQALILALNGGTGTQLGDWLAATLTNIYGNNAGGNDLAGKSNAYIASFFQGLFAMQGPKLDAEVLATALSVYVTNATLDNTGVGEQYGFSVSGNGVGTATVNVGSDGDAFGVANTTTLTVMDLLLATNNQAVNGLLYNGNTTQRKDANSVYSTLNETGGIS